MRYFRFVLDTPGDNPEILSVNPLDLNALIFL